MAQIPQLPDRSRLRGVPDAGGVPRVTPEDFGSRLYNDVYRLGGAVADAGQEHMAWTRRNAESQARSDLSAIYMKEMEEDRTQILMTSGSTAQESQKKMEEAIRKRSEAAHKRLKNPLARQVFDSMREDFDRQNLVQADRHAAIEQEKYEFDSRKAYQAGLIGECALPGGNNFAGNIEKIMAEDDMLHRGKPPEVIALEKQKSAMLAIKARAQAIAESDGPMAALGFLDSSVDKWVGNGIVRTEFTEFRNKLQKSGRISQVNQIASEWASNPAVTGEMVIEMADTMFPGDAEASEMLIRKYNSNVTARENAKKAEATSWKADVRTQLAQNGFDMSTVPKDVIVRDPEFYIELSKLSDDIAKISGKDVVPDLAKLDELLDRSPSAIKEFLYQPDNFRKMTLWGAGHSMGADRIKEIQDKSKMTDAEWEEKVSKSSGGSDAGMTKYSIPLNKYFKQNFGAMYKGWFGGDKTFDEKSAYDKLMANNFEVYYDMAYRGEQEKLGRRLSEAESEGLFYDLVEKVKRGDVDLEKPTAEIALTENKEQAQVTVDPNTLVLDQKAIYAQGRASGWSGEVYQVKNAETGQVEVFETLDPDDLYNTPGRIRDKNFKSVKRAYQPGVINGVNYPAGSVVCEDANEYTAAYDLNGNALTNPVRKIDPLGLRPSQGVTDIPLGSGRPSRTEDEPEWVEDRLKSLERDHGTNLVRHWTGNQLVVETPTLILTYNNVGSLIATQVNRTSF